MKDLPMIVLAALATGAVLFMFLNPSDDLFSDVSYQYPFVDHDALIDLTPILVSVEKVILDGKDQGKKNLNLIDPQPHTH